MLDPIPIQSHRDKTYRALRHAIFSGRLHLGQTVTETLLSRQLGVSRSIVREALQRLAAEGLVELNAYRNTSIFWLPPEQVVKLVELRALLEGVAAREAAARATPEAIQALRAQAAAVERARSGKDAFLFFEEDLNLHRMLWRLADNQPLERALDPVSTQLFSVMCQLRHRDQQRFPRGEYSHEELVELLERGEDPRKAERWMNGHVSLKWWLAAGYGDRYRELFSTRNPHESPTLSDTSRTRAARG